MIYRGKVVDVNDPENLGRIKARLYGFSSNDEENITPWAWPVMPFAGNGYGGLWLPVVGDEICVIGSEQGDFIWLGGYWTPQNVKPADASPTVRAMQTPAGHKVKFDESGDIEIESKDGATITLEDGGNVVIMGADEIHLNGAGGKVVTTQCVCSLTGAAHPQGSLNVKARGWI